MAERAANFRGLPEPSCGLVAGFVLPVLAPRAISWTEVRSATLTMPDGPGKLKAWAQKRGANLARTLAWG